MGTGATDTNDPILYGSTIQFNYVKEPTLTDDDTTTDFSTANQVRGYTARQGSTFSAGVNYSNPLAILTENRITGTRILLGDNGQITLNGFGDPVSDQFLMESALGTSLKKGRLTFGVDTATGAIGYNVIPVGTPRTELTPIRLTVNTTRLENRAMRLFYTVIVNYGATDPSMAQLEPTEPVNGTTRLDPNWDLLETLQVDDVIRMGITDVALAATLDTSRRLADPNNVINDRYYIIDQIDRDARRPDTTTDTSNKIITYQLRITVRMMPNMALNDSTGEVVKATDAQYPAHPMSHGTASDGLRSTFDTVATMTETATTAKLIDDNNAIVGGFIEWAMLRVGTQKRSHTFLSKLGASKGLTNTTDNRYTRIQNCIVSSYQLNLVTTTSWESTATIAGGKSVTQIAPFVTRANVVQAPEVPSFSTGVTGGQLSYIDNVMSTGASVIDLALTINNNTTPLPALGQRNPRSNTLGTCDVEVTYTTVDTRQSKIISLAEAGTQSSFGYMQGYKGKDNLIIDGGTEAKNRAMMLFMPKSTFSYTFANISNNDAVRLNTSVTGNALEEDRNIGTIQSSMQFHSDVNANTKLPQPKDTSILISLA